VIDERQVVDTKVHRRYGRDCVDAQAGGVGRQPRGGSGVERADMRNHGGAAAHSRDNRGEHGLALCGR
jgi:hypothetical protein